MPLSLFLMCNGIILSGMIPEVYSNGSFFKTIN